MRLLLSHGLEIDEGLWDAYDPQNPDFFQLLLSAGASANIRDGSGDSLLHRALLGNHPEMFELLLTHGADVGGLDHYGRSCHDYATASPAGFEKFDMVPRTSDFSNTEARIGRLYETALRGIESVVGRDPKLEAAYPALRQLAHSLMYLEWLDEAVTVYQMTIFEATEPQTGFRNRAFCDGCTADCPDTNLHVCRQCRDVDLCEPCFGGYGTTSLKEIHLCREHEFLEIPLVPFDEEYTQFLPRVTPKVRDHLLQLREKLLQERPGLAISDLEREDTLVNETTDSVSFTIKSRATRIDIEEYVDLNEFT